MVQFATQYVNIQMANLHCRLRPHNNCDLSDRHTDEEYHLAYQHSEGGVHNFAVETGIINTVTAETTGVKYYNKAFGEPCTAEVASSAAARPLQTTKRQWQSLQETLHSLIGALCC